MEYLQGQSLREYMQSQGTLSIQTALDVANQLLLAMIHAHAKGFIHRDLKPDNVFLLNQAGLRLHVRVLDFGIARIYHAEEAPRSRDSDQNRRHSGNAALHGSGTTGRPSG